MKRKTIVLVSFLLMLYIAPMIFMSSYVPTVTPLEQTMSKEFAISANWYDTNWLYRKNITLDGASGAGINYAVGVDVTYDSDMQADFDDIRFTDDGGVTLLDYWRETYIASTSAEFWVKVSDDLETSAMIYMYFGNPDVNTISNGTNTFIFFDDFENSNFNRWTDPTSDIWTIQGGTVKEGTLAARANSNAGDRFVGYNFSSPVSWSFLYHADVRITTVSSQYSYFCLADESNADDVYIGFTSSDDWATYDGGVVVFEAGTITVDTWFEQEIAVDFDDTELQCWIDGAAKTTKPLVDSTDNAVADIAQFKMGSVAVENFDLYVDDYYIRKWVNDEPVVDEFGSKEYLYPPEWNDAGEATVYFSVPFDYWAFDMFLILFGLVLVIASGCYLAYSLKHNMTQDKLFFFLIVFMLGWGLFLGGMLL